MFYNEFDVLELRLECLDRYVDRFVLVEAEVNRHIRENDDVTTRLMTPDAAIEAGAMALFGEK